MCIGVPGEVCEISQGNELERMGKVRFGDITTSVYLGFVPEAQVGDFVIVHVGFAISRLDRQQAQQVLATLQSLPSMTQETTPTAIPLSATTPATE